MESRKETISNYIDKIRMTVKTKEENQNKKEIQYKRAKQKK